MEFYEIHRYDNGIFQYVVTRTNKHSERKVKEDVNKMNQMLTAQENHRVRGMNS